MHESPLPVTFLVASIILAVSPGPGVLYIVTRSLSEGRNAGLAAVVRLAFGNLCNLTATVMGLGALFAISSVAFSVVKYAGAAYLVCLGARTILNPTSQPELGKLSLSSKSKIFKGGFWVALLNPKTTLFFAAFLPQFMSDPNTHWSYTFVLGVIFVAIASVTDACYALLSGSVEPILSRATGVSSKARYLAGGTYVILGVLASSAENNLS